jgi:2',5'-phosphodiesterase
MVFDLAWRTPAPALAPGADGAASASAAADGPASAAAAAPVAAGGLRGGGRVMASAAFEEGGEEAAGGGGRVLSAAAPGSVAAAAAALAAGGVVAVPTDTLYGLAACARCGPALARILEIKRRAPQKPLALCVAEVSEVAAYGETSHLPPGLLEALLPGPVTLLLARRPGAPLAAALNPGAAAIGLRVPDSPFIRAVCRAHGGALALTSANVSGASSTVEVGEFAPLWPQLEAVFDGGRVAAGDRAGSTIIDLTAPGAFRITRVGAMCERLVALLSGRFGLRQEAASGGDGGGGG